MGVGRRRPKIGNERLGCIGVRHLGLALADAIRRFNLVCFLYLAVGTDLRSVGYE